MDTETRHGPLQAQAIDEVFINIVAVIPRTTDEDEVALHSVGPALPQKTPNQAGWPDGKTVKLLPGEALVMRGDLLGAGERGIGAAEEYESHEDQDQDHEHQAGVFAEGL